MYPRTLILLILIQLQRSTTFYNITQLNYGFLFEIIDTIQLQASTWTFVSHINLTTYQQELEYANNLVEEARRQCEILSVNVKIAELCSDIISEQDIELIEIKSNNEYIISPNRANDNQRKKTRTSRHSWFRTKTFILHVRQPSCPEIHRTNQEPRSNAQRLPKQPIFAYNYPKERNKKNDHRLKQTRHSHRRFSRRGQNAQPKPKRRIHPRPQSLSI